MGWQKAVAILMLPFVLSGCVGGIAAKYFAKLGPPPCVDPPPHPSTKSSVPQPSGKNGSAQPDEDLSLRRALWLAHIYNPELAVFSHEVLVRDAKMLQAALRPNPEIGAEIENFAGTGDANGSESTETTIMLSQLIPLGGKIHKRVRVSKLDRDLSVWDYEAKRLEIMKQVTQKFVRVLVAQEKLKLAREEIALAKELFEVADKGFRAGRSTIADKTRAEAFLARQGIAIQREGYELAAARHSLAAMWGSPRPKFRMVVGNLFKMKRIPEWKVFVSWISRNPQVARWACEMSKRWAELSAAQAQRIPDLTAGLAIRRINRPAEGRDGGGTVLVPNDTTLVAELSMPIPVFDRNQGNILAIKSNLAKGAQERRAAWTRVQRQITEAYFALLAARSEVETTRRQVVPRLESVFNAHKLAFREGHRGYLSVLEAQSSLIAERRRYVDALGKYHNTLAVLESFLGEPIKE